ncbi:MAG TPA: hypothetical protein DEV93_12905 [Chloroflexi bacterium]|jgi:hypothetical protein|nr:hypothetical protein [Chloroflexota bacterium]
MTVNEIEGELLDEEEVGLALPEQSDSTLTEVYGGISQQAMLASLEEKIEQGLQTFVEVGLALMEIRDRKLYRGEHSSFKEYCKERWNFGDSRARQLIAAAKLTQGLYETAATNGNAPVVVLNERQARKLAREQREPEITEAEFEVIEETPRPTPDAEAASSKASVAAPPEPAEGELVYGIHLTATELRELIALLRAHETDNACLRGVLEELIQARPETNAT